MSKVLVISVKPEYANEIINGRKSIELRKQKPKIEVGTTVLVYSTNPEKSVVGVCRVVGFIKMTPNKIWKLYSSKLGITKKRFQEYYSGVEYAIGIQLEVLKKFQRPVELSEVRKRVRKFSPPQTFNYLGEDEFRKIA